MTPHTPMRPYWSWLCLTTCVALGYFTAGQIGLLLSTPPGFATAVWPAAGIALGAVLLYGNRVLAGVFLGSSIINLLIASRVSGVDIWHLSWSVPLLIGMGAAIQAWLGQYLIKTFIKFPQDLDEPSSILRLLLIGGLVSTLFNSTWSSSLLYFFHIISANRWWQNWLTWWVGDSIGVFLFTPLLLVWGLKLYHRARSIIVSIVLLVCFSLTVLGFFLVAHLERKDRITRFQYAGDATVAQIMSHLHGYEEFSQQVRNLMYAQPNLTRQQFKVFVKEWLSQHPEVVSANWVQHVPEAQRAEFETRMSEELGYIFHIREYGHLDPMPSTIQPREYLPLTYIEPEQPAQIVAGIDISTEPVRFAALRTTIATGQSTVTDLIRLMSVEKNIPAAILYTPVYQTPHSPHQWSELKGLVSLALSTHAAINRALDPSTLSDLDIVITDAQTHKIWYGQIPNEARLNIAKIMGLHYTVTRQLSGRTWQIDFWPTASRIARYESWLTWTVLVVGLLGTSLAVAFALINSGRQQLLERMVALRTKELTQRNHELEVARAEADQANIAKGQFLTNMSHEIRTPMNAIIGFAQLMQDVDINEKAHSYLEKINHSSKLLLSIINDILDFSKIETRELKISAVDINLDDVLESVVQQVVQLAAPKELDFILDVDPDVPPYIIGDPIRIAQVLINLCNYAIRYTSQGNLILYVNNMVNSEGKNYLAFKIKSHHVDINVDQLEDVVTPFEQKEAKNNHKYYGSTLNLTICRHLIQLMGGEVEQGYVPSEGGLFQFSIAYQPSPSTDMWQGLAGTSVVVASVCPDELLAWQHLLTRMQMHTTTLPLSETLPQQVHKLVAQQMCDVIILDDISAQTQLLARFISELPVIKPPKIILLGNVEATYSTDIAVCLRKPVTSPVLLQVLRWLFRMASDQALLDPMRVRFHPVHVLLVEDNYVNQRVAADMLTRLGLHVVVASSGQQALDLLEDQDANYALVLMDLQMPVMDGFEATRRIRHKWSVQQLPIIALTAHVMAEERQRCFQVGMNGHLGKPIVLQSLIEVLSPFLVMNDSALIEPSVLPEDILFRQGIIELARLLRRRSMDARQCFEIWQPELLQRYPAQVPHIIVAMNKLDFRLAYQYLAEVALMMEVVLD